MTHMLVDQLRFSRSELVRCLDGVTGEEATRRFLPMNCISWIIGHLAWQEQYLWVYCAQGKVIAPSLDELVGFGKPASTPPLAEMWAVWREITAAADVYLDTLTPFLMSETLECEGYPLREDVGTMLLRNIYHYWFHIGEAHAVRQQLGHTDLPQFVGDINAAGAGYRPE